MLKVLSIITITVFEYHNSLNDVEVTWVNLNVSFLMTISKG